jgi:hypothetical protein
MAGSVQALIQNTNPIASSETNQVS